MGHLKSRTTGFGLTLLMIVLLSCMGNQPANAGLPNPNDHAVGAGKADAKAGPGLNVAKFQPVYLSLSLLDSNGCPDPDFGVVASPDPVTIHRDFEPTRIVWIVRDKDKGNLYKTTWTIWGGDADYYMGSQKGSSTGQNPFPDPTDPGGKKVKRTMGPGQNSANPGPNAYWSEAPQLPPTVDQDDKDIHWKYTVEVTGIDMKGKDGNPCPTKVTTDPIVIFPGGGG